MVSVIIPTYNRAETIEASIKSVLNQTCSDLEVIIVNDCSTDNTAEIVTQIINKDSRVSYIRLTTNMGACVARNKGIELAKGEYVAFQDSDDVWNKDKLEKQIYALQKNSADIVVCAMSCISVDGTCEGVLPNIEKEGFLTSPVDIFNIGTQTILVKNEIAVKYPFDAEMPRFQDLEWLARVARCHSIYFVTSPLVAHKIGCDSISASNKKLFAACKLILEKHPDFAKEYPSTAMKISKVLISAANNLKKTDSDYGKILVMAKEFSRSYSTLGRVLLVKLGLYSTFKLIKHSFAE